LLIRGTAAAAGASERDNFAKPLNPPWRADEFRSAAIT
jgi:hypothetical protein